jgi:hypothetical protein
MRNAAGDGPIEPGTISAGLTASDYSQHYRDNAVPLRIIQTLSQI